MNNCVMCNKEVSTGVFQMKDKYEIIGHKFICKDCANFLKINNFFQAGCLNEKKLRKRYMNICFNMINGDNNINERNELKKYINFADIRTLNYICIMQKDIEDVYNYGKQKYNLYKIDLSKYIYAFYLRLEKCKSFEDIKNTFNLGYYQMIIDSMELEYKKIISFNVVKNDNDIKNKIKIRTMIEEFDSFASFRILREYNKIYDSGSESEKKIWGNYQFRYMFMLCLYMTNIMKIIFAIKQVYFKSDEDEFCKIVSNMQKEMADYEMTIQKSKVVFNEFYKSQFGNIEDDILYDIMISLIISNNEKTSNDFIEESNSDIDSEIIIWIDKMAKDFNFIEIQQQLLVKCKKLLKDRAIENYIEIFSNFNNYENLYKEKREHYDKFNRKERYLKGDFEKEKKELSSKYSLNNIITGTQFELYLVNLFKDLGYKTKHNGKTGDQGCDLVLKKDDYVYAVQAKYYTGKLSNTPVQEIVGALKYYNANQGVVVTNSSFTPGAEKLAKANNVILIDGKDLKKLVNYIFEENHDEDVLKKFEKYN